MKIVQFSPLILQSFDKNLLFNPVPKLCDDSKRLAKIYSYISLILSRKLWYNKKGHEKFTKLEQEFLELYAQVIAKEKAIEEKTGKPVHQPFSYFKGLDRNYKTVLNKIRFK